VQLVQPCSSHPGFTGLLEVIAFIFRRLRLDDRGDHGCRIRGRYKQRLESSTVNAEPLLAHAIAALSGVIALTMVEAHSRVSLPPQYDSLCTNAPTPTCPRRGRESSVRGVFPLMPSVESDVITLTMVSRGDACVAPTAAVGFTCVNVTNVVLTIQ
jgi:hypothetical protein